jgi:nucleotide-binding universal stress UspA family protein
MTTSWIDHPPKRILLATDLSARSDRALDRAASLAKLWGAELIVVHAMPASIDDLGDERALRSWRRSADARKLAAWRVEADIGDALPASSSRVVVGQGDPADLILQTAESHACDLIVTGVARDELFGRLVLGSTVDRLLRRSPVPLLVVRKRGRPPYRHVVVATDFSAPSRYALQSAMRAFPQHMLGIFHAYDAPLSGLVADKSTHQQQFRDIAAEEAAAFLASLDFSGWMGEQPEILLHYGAPEQVLSTYAREQDVDLMVMATHGRTALADVLIGSVAGKLVDAVPCDVLVIRAPQQGSVAKP